MRYARGVGESFVDLTYRGLPLGRRIKLTQIRPSAGFLELPAPMPVGTRIGISAGDGVALEAIVTQVIEQSSGSERAPGMTVALALAEGAPDDAGRAWWRERSSPEDAAAVAAVPAAVPAAPAPDPAVALARTRTTSAISGAPPVSAPPVDDARPTEEMAPPAAVAPTVVVAATKTVEEVPSLLASERPTNAMDPDVLQQLVDASSELPLVDDGKKTIMMRSVDLSALGLETGSSGQFSTSRDEVAEGEDGDTGEGEGELDETETSRDSAAEAAAGPDGAPKPSGKKRKKRR